MKVAGAILRCDEAALIAATSAVSCDLGELEVDNTLVETERLSGFGSVDGLGRKSAAEVGIGLCAMGVRWLGVRWLGVRPGASWSPPE